MGKEDELIVALAGNPNTGKSTIFNSLTGLKQHTGNWSGKTVNNAGGYYEYKGKRILLVDLPGTYSLYANSPEEEVARDFICLGRPLVTVVVVDATCMERNLNLVLQILELTSKVVVCVNLMDEATRKGIKVDLTRLSNILKVPVVGTNARGGQGLAELKEMIYKVMEIEQDFSCNNHMSVDSVEPQVYGQELQESKVTGFIKKAEKIRQEVVTYENKNYQQLDRQVDKILMSKRFGIPIMLALLGLVFWLTIQGANYPSELLAKVFFWLEGHLTAFFLASGLPAWMYGIVVEGIYRTLSWVIAVMLPPMAIFFPLFTLLEDLGYLPRIAFNLDNFFKKACAHGKQALTMCMGFGCNAAGVIACRIIDSSRERLIAIITNNFVPCNGRFPTLITLAMVFLVADLGAPWQSLGAAMIILAVIMLSVIITLFVSRILSKTILRGLPSSFTLELPPYRKPQIGKVIIRSIFDRTLFVLMRAAIVAAPAGALIWLLANVTVNEFSVLHHCADFIDPLARIFGLDGYILTAFILGLPANEIVIPIIIMSYLSTGSLQELGNLEAVRDLFIQNGWTWLTALCMMLLVLNHFPCGTTLFTICKETHSIKWTIVSFLIPTVVGLFLCFLVAQSVSLLGLL